MFIEMQAIDRSEEKKEEEGNKRPCLVPQRYIVLVFATFSMILLLGLRVNLSVTLVYMAAPQKSEADDQECVQGNRSNSSSAQQVPKEFSWDGHLQGDILSSYFWGFVAAQLLGGLLANRFGFKNVLAVGGGIPSILTLLTPTMARLNVYALIVLRIVIGFFAGFIIPCSYQLAATWAPMVERAFFVSVMYNGLNVGAFLGLGISGYLCVTEIDGGWPLPFYVFGGVGVLWAILFLIVIVERPSDSRYITQKELTYLKDNISNVTKRPIPWIKIITCVPFWAFVTCNVAHNWILDLSNIVIPSYMGRVLAFDIVKNGIVSGTPFLIKIPFSIMLSIVCDWVYRRFAFTSTTKLRKFCSCLGFLGSTIFLAAIPFVKCEKMAAVALMCLALIFSGMHSSGFLYSVSEMTPDFSAILIGISNTMGNISGFLVPWIVARINGDHESLESWRTTFFVSAAVQAVAGIVYLIFGSSEKQSWA